MPTPGAKRYINPYRLFAGAFLPNWLLDRRELGPGAKLTYARLMQYAGDAGVAFPRIKTLAAEIGMSYGSVKQYLRELRDAGLIEATPRYTSAGDTDSNEYRFFFHLWMGRQRQIRPPSNAVSRVPGVHQPSDGGLSAEYGALRSKDLRSEENHLREGNPRYRTAEETKKYLDRVFADG